MSWSGDRGGNVRPAPGLRPDKAAAFGASSSRLSAPQLFTIAPGQPFLRHLARAILNGDLPTPGGTPPDPLALARFTILLPTRRAARALSDAFLDEVRARQGLSDTAPHAMLLPRIRPIAQAQEDLSLLTGLSHASASLAGGDEAHLPPAVNEMERRLVLTQLVLAWAQAQRDAAGPETVAAGAAIRTPAQAAKLAGELGHLIDLVETEGVSLDGLARLVPDDLAAHWQETLAFLQIITAFWPRHLEERRLLSPMDHRNRVLHAQAERISATPLPAPLIVAGVTGSIPATVALMQAVARDRLGAIVLPGFDAEAPADELLAMLRPGSSEGPGTRQGESDHANAKADAVNDDGGHPEHPQHSLHRLVTALGATPADVLPLPATSPPSPEAPPSSARTARNRLINRAMAPASASDRWHSFMADQTPQTIEAAFTGVHLIEAPSVGDEAETIALILRAAAEVPGRTAALVSPDRRLARRVAARLASFGITVDDSAGRPFVKTVPGTFLALIAHVVASDFAPAAVTALMKHPLFRCGLPAGDVRRAARAVELRVFRRLYLGAGLAGIRAGLVATSNEDFAVDGAKPRPLNRKVMADVKALLFAMEQAFAPWGDALAHREPLNLKTLARHHANAAAALSALPDHERDGSSPQASAAPVLPAGDALSPLWAGDAGEAAAAFFAGLLDPDITAPTIAPTDYPELYRGLTATQTVRTRHPVHPRLSIWGPFEARLQQPDVVVLGSLNEKSWPEVADPGPWLNRPMRRALGLPAPEAAIGYAAHDFTMLMGADTVYLTRSAKVDGVPTVASRWLLRLEALLAGGANQQPLAAWLKPDQPWLAWARHRDSAAPAPAILAPSPRPPLGYRPRRLSVTAIKTWLENPYAIHAAHVLALSPLPALEGEPDAKVRGIIVHEILSRFAQTHPNLPADIEGAFERIAVETLGALGAHPRVRALWLPRLRRFATWFAAHEPAWRTEVERLITETAGEAHFDAPAGTFTLSARADRIEARATGLTITDYKTGTPPKKA
ncbi:MAG: double-strand break repair protein AddB, partial [Pseudomonadota bacterium]